MAGIACLLVLLLAGLETHGFLHSRKEGEPCTQRDRVPGVCTGVRRCRGGMARIFRSGTKIVFCSYGVDGPIICCPSLTSPMNQRLIEPTAAEQHLLKAPESAAIVMKKCAEYGKYAYEKRELETLLVVREFVYELKCTLAEELVVGGQKAERNQFPHMAALGYVDQEDKRKVEWKCAGSLISEWFVLTAAHCTSAAGTYVTLVRLGTLTLKHPSPESIPQTISVVERIRHPRYKKREKYYDIALLKLERSPKLGIDVRPACLYTEQGNPPTHKYAVATGWGLTHADNEENSDDLMKVRLEFFPTEKCDSQYKDTYSSELSQGISDSMMICSGDNAGVNDTCMGDSGGPLQIRLGTPVCMYSIVGVTSFGNAICNSSNQAGVYTRVSHYIPWIQSLVWP